MREKLDLSFAVRFNADICQCLPSGTHGFTLIWLLRPGRTLLFVQMTVDRRVSTLAALAVAGAREMAYAENSDLHTTLNSIGNYMIIVSGRTTNSRW